MDLLDAHVHLLGKKIFRNIDELRLNWLNNNIKQILHVSSTLHESKKSFESFKSFQEVLIGVGKHPWKVKQTNEEEQKEFEKLIAKKEGTAIGEVGLDYYAIKDTNRYEYQKDWFTFFIEMSNKYQKAIKYTSNWCRR